jgi:hypothetical protein
VEKSEPNLNNKMVIKMRVVITGASGFDSQQRRCMRSAVEEEPTFQALPLSSSLPPCPGFDVHGGKSFIGATSSPIALP